MMDHIHDAIEAAGRAVAGDEDYLADRRAFDVIAMRAVAAFLWHASDYEHHINTWEMSGAAEQIDGILEQQGLPT